jgi:hypothetical protein
VFPEQRLVLVGLSQRAEVIRRTLVVADSDIEDRITAIVLHSAKERACPAFVFMT